MNLTDRILIVTSVEAEREAIIQQLASDRIDVAVVGVGQAAAAAGTAAILAKQPYALVINAGIGGGFKGQADIGAIVLASEVIAADLGAESAEGALIPIDELGFGSGRITAEQQLSARWQEAIVRRGIDAVIAPIITVNTATGTQRTADAWTSRVHGVAAEAMEGFGAGTAAKQIGIPFIEIRAISNAVGPRDRSAWRIKDALQSLATACSVLTEVI